MARQAKLLASLDEPPRPAHSPLTPAGSISSATPSNDPAEEAQARALATAHFESGALAAARAALDPFADRSKHVGTLTTFARICTEQGDFAPALAALQRAEELDPADRKVWRLIAKLLTTQRRFREALVYLRRIALVDADAPAAAHVELLRGLMRSFEKNLGPTRSQASRAELEAVLRRFEAAPGADDELRMQFAGLYYLLSYGSPDAVRIYTTASPCPPSHRDVTARLMAVDAWCHERGRPVLRGAGSSTAHGGLAVFSLNDAQIHPALGWAPVLDEGRVLVSGSVLQSRHFRGVTPDSPLMLFRGSHAELRIPRDMPVEPSPAFLVGGSHSYFECLVRDVAGLAAAEDAGLPTATPLVVPAGMAPFQRELLDLLGYGHNRLIEAAAERPVQLSELMVPAPLSKLPRSVDPVVPRWYRARLVQSQATSSRRIYLAPGPEVALTNEDAVAALTQALGFERIDVGNLSVKDQVELFSQAAQVVGATSEGLSNIVFAAPGTRVLELRPAHWVASGGHVHAEALAAACGHRYAAADCTRAGQTSDGVAVSVDVDGLARELEAWT